MSDNTLNRIQGYVIFPDKELASVELRFHNAEFVGARHLLKMYAWSNTPQCFLPNDDKKLMNICKISAQKWKKFKKDLLKDWKIYGDFIYSPELLDQWQKIIRRGYKKNISGFKGAMKRWHPHAFAIMDEMGIMNDTTTTSGYLFETDKVPTTDSTLDNVPMSKFMAAPDHRTKGQRIIVWKGSNIELDLQTFLKWMEVFKLGSPYQLSVMLDLADKEVSLASDEIHNPLAWARGKFLKLFNSNDLMNYISSHRNKNSDPKRYFLGEELVLSSMKNNNNGR